MWIHKQQLSTTTGVCCCWGGSEEAQVEKQGRCPPSPGLQASGRQTLISSHHPGYMLRRMGLQREKKGTCFSQVGGEGLADTHPRPERWSKPGNKKSSGGPEERQPRWAGLQVVREEQTCPPRPGGCSLCAVLSAFPSRSHPIRMVTLQGCLSCLADKDFEALVGQLVSLAGAWVSCQPG